MDGMSDNKMTNRKVNVNEIRLPFGQKKKKDPVNWMYKHRVGFLTTIVVHLVIILIILTYRIIIHPVPINSSTVEIPDEELDKLMETIEELKEAKALADVDYSKAANRISDVNSKLDASIADHRHSNVQAIYDEAESVEKSLSEGADEYRKALEEIEAMSKASKKQRTEKKQEAESTKQSNVRYQGNVTVMYDLEGRVAHFLYMPAYKCKEAGVVIVNISVDRNGNVTQASISSTTDTDSNACVNEMAEYAARSSKFDASSKAPDPQKGTIRYQFEAQE